ncbi:MAG: FecR domain-containing protein [Tannerellaceae bacterium]|nr:FecR domain-containing protein [Tannerellaceae bacterium]
MENKKTYTLTDLLEDEDFIAFANRPEPEGEAKWRQLIGAGKMSEKDFRLAMFCVSKFGNAPRNPTDDELSGMWAGVQKKIRMSRAARWRSIFVATSVAAACVAVAAGLVFIRLQPSDSDREAMLMPPKITEVPLPPTASEDIRIVFADNNCIALKEKTARILYNDQGVAEINSQTIVPAGEQSESSKETGYNQVIVPAGRHSFLELSDGTRIWLNASSRLVYPPVFKTSAREVYLEGEAYVEVNSDKNRPFVVKTGMMEVTATGTTFNVAAYTDEEVQWVVLVAGAVSVQTGSTATLLSPSQMLSLSGGAASLNTVNVEKYISWRDGIYIYSNEKLARILNRLSHYYGIAVSCEPKAGELLFTGKLDMKNDPERVLNGFSKTAPVKCKQENGAYIIYYINP